MSVGSQARKQNNEIAYYEMKDSSIKANLELINLFHPGAGEQIRAVVSEATQRIIAETISAVELPENADEKGLRALRNNTWGAMHLLDMEGVTEEILTAANAKAAELKITDTEILGIIRQLATDVYDLRVTMEKDHWDR